MDKKVYKPMSYGEAYQFVVDTGLKLEGMSGPEILIYAEVLKLHQRIDEIENQANELMSPEKMMDMASGFLGGGMKL